MCPLSDSITQARSALKRAEDINRKIEAERNLLRQRFNNAMCVVLILLFAAGTLVAECYGL